MAARRPLTIGVNTPDTADPESVRAFITQERTKPAEADIVRTPLAAVERASEVSAVRPPRRKPAKITPIGLIPVTVRLRPEIAGALKRASLERQLSGEELFTQQEIVEQALEPWLTREGYLA